MSEIARTGYIILGRQAAKGTPAVTMGPYGLRVTTQGIGGNSERLDDEDEIGGSRDTDTSAAVMGGFHVSGSIEGLFRPRAFGLLLLAAGFTAGAPVQDGATGAYTHTFTPSTFTYLTVEGRWGSTAAIRRWTDCLVNELTVSLDANGKATWSASLIGLAESWQGAASAPTFETDPVADYSGSAASFDGLGTYRFQSMEFALANNLSDDEWVIGSRFLDDTTAGDREVTMSGTVKVGSNSPAVTDLYRAFVYGSKTATSPGSSAPYHTAAAYTFGSPKLVGTSTTVRYGMTVTAPDVVVNGLPLEGSGSDRLTVDFEGKAYAGASPVATIALSNGFATAYTAA